MVCHDFCNRPSARPFPIIFSAADYGVIPKCDIFMSQIKEDSDGKNELELVRYKEWVSNAAIDHFGYAEHSRRLQTKLRYR